MALTLNTRSLIIGYWWIEDLGCVDICPRWLGMQPQVSPYDRSKLFSARRQHDQFIVATFRRGMWDSAAHEAMRSLGE